MDCPEHRRHNPHDITFYISVSVEKGRYRHIKISAAATLYELHGIFAAALCREGIQTHSFLLGKRDSGQTLYRSGQNVCPGEDSADCKLYKVFRPDVKFTYISGAEDGQKYKCRVLRMKEEETQTPSIVRGKGMILPPGEPELQWKDARM